MKIVYWNGSPCSLIDGTDVSKQLVYIFRCTTPCSLIEVPIIGGFRKLHNEQLFNVHSSTNVITMIVMEDEMGKESSSH